MKNRALFLHICLFGWLIFLSGCVEPVATPDEKATSGPTEPTLGAEATPPTEPKPPEPEESSNPDEPDTLADDGPPSSPTPPRPVVIGPPDYPFPDLATQMGAPANGVRSTPAPDTGMDSTDGNSFTQPVGDGDDPFAGLFSPAAPAQPKAPVPPLEKGQTYGAGFMASVTQLQATLGLSIVVDQLDSALFALRLRDNLKAVKCMVPIDGSRLKDQQKAILTEAKTNLAGWVLATDFAGVTKTLEKDAAEVQDHFKNARYDKANAKLTALIDGDKLTRAQKTLAKGLIEMLPQEGF